MGVVSDVRRSLACHGASYFETAAIATNVKNYPEDRGRVIGLLKTCIGLSAAIVTTICESLL